MWFPVLALLALQGPTVSPSASCGDGSCYVNNDAVLFALIDRYFPTTHPPKLLMDTVHVMLEIYNIIDINEKAETITTKLWLYMAYSPAGVTREVWNRTLGAEIVSYDVPAHRVWKPDIVILNSVEELSNSFDRAVITLEATVGVAFVVFAAPLTQTTTCTFDVTDFPFDYQQCNIELGSWWRSLNFSDHYKMVGQADDMTDDTDTLLAFNPARRMNLLSFHQNSQWQLIDAPYKHVQRKSRYGNKLRDTYLYKAMTYTLKLKRRPDFFVMTFTLPCSFLSALSALSVFLPVDSGEKISLGITIMLAQTVNLLILSNLLPASSLYFPNMGRYFLTTIGLISITLLHNTIVIHVYYDGDTFVLRTFQRHFCSEEYPSAESEKGEKKKKKWNEIFEVRRAMCKLADRVFGSAMVLLNLAVHAYFFGHHILG